MLQRSLYCVARQKFHSVARVNAKAAKAGIKGVLVEEPAPVRDTKVLQQFCCGLNFMKDGKDPELKPDSEYPDWLWNIHTGPPKTYRDFDQSTREYWHAIEKAQKEHQQQIQGDKEFYIPPKDHELNFYSRLERKKTE